jgi:hypothetical protein
VRALHESRNGMRAGYGNPIKDRTKMGQRREWMPRARRATLRR